MSPGAARRALLASSCPTFSWAPGAATSAHEVGVYILDEAAQLSASPVLTAVLPARASSWTPSASDCLRSGTRYMWFLRELGPNGPGDWSAGLAFTVAGKSEPEDDRSQNGDAPVAHVNDSTDAGEATPAPKSAAATPPAAEGPKDPHLNPNDAILAALVTVNTKLDQLLDPVKKEICFELAAELEGGVEYGGKIDAEFEGRVGAEGFGNGVMGKVKAPMGFDFGAALKGTASPKFSICRELGASANASLTPTQQRMAASVSNPAASTQDLTSKLLALAEQLQINEARASAALDALPGFSSGSDPFSAIRNGGPLAKLADVVPLPEDLRSTLRDPGQVIAGFKSQIALCTRNDLPAAVAGLVGEFCALANTEKFKTMIEDIASGVGNVKSTLTTIGGKVQDVIDKIAILDCKLFCG
ncbi:MAG TPA: hypothetical protein VFV98_06125 [Vicinamibacterales bacterium]|nr:hypothetical protein [Vicinamibacterales bacterium]